ncbi:MAG: HD domain-containing phosphohydrolase [Methylococcales bacterium]
MPNHPILIVDDEPTNLSILRHILEPDYRLVIARNGKEAIAAAGKHSPTLILLDVKMPDMNGYQVCAALKADPNTEHIPIIFVTSLVDFGNEEHGFEVGCVDYLSKPVVPSLVRARVRTHLSLVQTAQLEKSHRDAVFMLGEAGHYKDNDTGVHIWRMAAYSKVLAKALGWTTTDAQLLELAAPMHDTGKIGIPDAILCKPGNLDAEEWLIMQSHCQMGHDILSKSDAPIFKLAAEVALSHHEKWDGSGYPSGLRAEAIPASARIVAVADVFDALTMRRPYKEPWPLTKALTAILDGSGRHFDPTVVDCFSAIYAQILDIRTEWEQRLTDARHSGSAE